MKSILLVAALLGSMTSATPLLDKRYMVTSVVLETATVTVTRGWWDWGRPTQAPAATNTISVISTSTPSVSTTPSATSAPSTSTTPAISSSSLSSSSLSSSSTSSTSTSTSDTTSQPTGSVSAYADPILRQHNLHRANHSAPALAWDDRLASIAQEIASSCQYAHNVKAGGGGYGQNIGAGAPDDEIDKMITNQMYNDEMEFYPGYNAEPDMSNFEKWGHFSQIVWKSTTNVGCFTQHCTDGLAGVSSNVSPYFTVCNYASAGNVGGHGGLEAGALAVGTTAGFGGQ